MSGSPQQAPGSFHFFKQELGGDWLVNGIGVLMPPLGQLASWESD